MCQAQNLAYSKLVSAQEMVIWKAYAKFYSRMQVYILKITVVHSKCWQILKLNFLNKPAFFFKFEN